LRDLSVEEVGDDVSVRIEEYDGSERVVTKYEDWM